MAERHPVILIGTALLVCAFTYVSVSQLTVPWRGAAAGVLLATASGVLIWHAKTRRHALARALFACAATLVAAPGAGLAAAQNDFLFGMISNLESPGDINDSAFDQYELAMRVGLQMLGIGAVAAIVLLIIGVRMHRNPQK